MAENDAAEAERLLARGADPDDGGEGVSMAPMHVAAMGEQPELLLLLLRAGAATELRDDEGSTPLHIAARASPSHPHPPSPSPSPSP